MTLTSVARDVVTLVGLVGVMIWQDWLLSLIASDRPAADLWPALRDPGCARHARGRRAQQPRDRRHAGGDQGIAIVKAFTMEDQLPTKVDTHDRPTAEKRSNRIASG
jgi:hypothetical protein